jgi:hypothetical protein
LALKLIQADIKRLGKIRIDKQLNPPPTTHKEERKKRKENET